MDAGAPFYPPGQRLKACDLCHTRKIRCDRQPNCQHCLAAKVPCTRTRPKFIRRPNGHALRRPKHVVPSHNDAASQKTTQSSEKLPINPSTLTAAETAQPKLADNQDPDYDEPVPSSGTETFRSGSSDYRETARSDRTDEASSFLRQELHLNTHLSPDRVSVLESALSLVRRFDSVSHAASTNQGMPPRSDGSSDTEIPRELFHMMLDDNRNSNHLYYHWPDHLPLSVLERFCMALDRGTVSDHVALHYRLCVLSKATAYINRRLRFCLPGFMADSLEQSKKKYTAAALQCLRDADFVSSPSLVTVQSLLAGASLLLLLGITSHAWNLTAFASRLLVTLGYHNSSQELLESGDSYEARHCLFWCYYLDKTLSMLLLRPPSLPALSSDPAALVSSDPDIPLTLEMKIMVKLARIQDIAISLLTSHPKTNDAHLSAIAADLELQLFAIYDEIKQVRPKWPSTLEFEIEWDSINFVFFSILTNIIRLDRPSVHRHARREECLLYARKALLSMQSLQTTISRSTKNTTDFLFWTILLYPLTPFFVVFCNVVATSDAHDLELLREVTAATSGFKEQCSVGRNVYELFSQFVHLCTQLPDTAKTRPSGQAHPPHTEGHPAGPELPSSSFPPISSPSGDVRGSSTVRGLPHMRTPNSLYLSSPRSPDHGYSSTEAVVPVHGDSAWGDELMLELFNIHPSVEWFDGNFQDFAGAP